LAKIIQKLSVSLYEDISMFYCCRRHKFT